jgi:hypothetical protein
VQGFPVIGELRVLDYRAFILGRDGRIQSAIEFRAHDDAEAIKLAQQYVQGHDVEVWQLARFVIQLNAKDPK